MGVSQGAASAEESKQETTTITALNQDVLVHVMQHLDWWSLAGRSNLFSRSVQRLRARCTP